MTHECPICLDTMDKNLITTECNHTFHKECFDIWCIYKNSCPLCRLSFYKIPDSNRLVVLSVIDNLVKGASGQAIQNMNIMMDWPESTGLDLSAIYP